MPAKTKCYPPIVGIGASAGGLEALEQFFTAIQAPSGTAFVVIQHLDPTHLRILIYLNTDSGQVEQIKT